MSEASHVTAVSAGAARQAAYRARRGVAVQLLLGAEVLEALDQYIERQHRDRDVAATRSTVVTKLIRSQLVRSR